MPKAPAPARAPAKPAPAQAPAKPAPGKAPAKPAPGPGRRAARSTGKAAGSTSRYLSRGSWRPRLSVPSKAHDAGGLALGLLLYTGAITYVRYGPAGWRGWLSAKFLNKPMQGLPGKGGPGKVDA